MSLHELLDRTIDTPAPTPFDLDRVIARARREEGRRRLVTGGAATAVAAFTGAAVWLVVGTAPSPSPPTLVAPDGPVDLAVLRVIEREEPEVQWQPGPDPVYWHSDLDATGTEYHGRGIVAVGQSVGEIRVTIERYEEAELPTSYSCVEPATYQCSVNYLPYGLIPGYPYARVHISRQYLDGSRWEYRETVYRSDGVMVDVQVDNNDGDGFNGRNPPLQPEQVEDIATDFSLTLAA